jgi:hypothetical protein
MSRVETYREVRARLALLSVAELKLQLQAVINLLDERDALEQGE